MARRCVLCNEKKSDETTLHLFPKQPALLTEWKRACEFADCDNVSTLRICSIHFQPHDYICYSRSGKRPGAVKRLQPNAVPSVNIPYNRENVSSNVLSGVVVKSEIDTVEGPAIKQEVDEKLFETIADQPSTSTLLEIIQVPTPKSSETIKVFSSEIATPKQAERALFHARFVQSQLRYKVKKLQQDKRRLTKRISTLQDLVRVLKKKAIISENRVVDHKNKQHKNCC